MPFIVYKEVDMPDINDTSPVYDQIWRDKEKEARQELLKELDDTWVIE